jgi:hypothetical protein
MIRDQRLRLATNLNIGAASRPYLSIQVSDLLPTAKLGEFGRGEQLFCCVTVTQEFTSLGSLNAGEGTPGEPGYIAPYIESGALVNISLKEESDYTVDIINLVDPVADQYANMLHRQNPTLGSTGWILNNVNITTPISITAKNFVVGKKFCFPISPVTHRTKFQSPTVIPSEYVGGKNVYILVEECGNVDENFVGTGNITAGKIDVDIVMVAESGASTTFNDVRYYPTGTIVR